MNEGAPVMYHGGGFGGPTPVYLMQGQFDRQAPRHYPVEKLQVMGSGIRGGGSPGGASGQGTPRRWQPRRDRHSNAKGDNTAFGYDSDDSSLSSNASGSNKSIEKVCAVETPGSSQDRRGGGNWHGAREWRGRHRRDQRPRRLAPDRYLHSSFPYQIKYTPDDLLNGSEFDTLSQEMWDKFVKSQQTEETFAKKMNLWRFLYVTIKSIFPRYLLYVVGSTMSGFGLESSDMDLCLYVRAADGLEPRSHALLHLNYVLNYIRSFDRNDYFHLTDAEVIQAKVPILKFRDARSGLHVDLNCNNVVGVRNTNLLYCFSMMDWRVRPLVTLTKLWAQAHNINDARQRTLSSYSLTLMVIHFLQCGTQPNILPRVCEAGVWDSRARLANRSSLAELFLNMLRYYATFPYDKMAVSVRAGQRIPIAECRAARAHKNDPHQWKLLCVEEPFDLTNTARSVYDPETFEKIVTTFRESHRRLASGLRLADAWPAAPAGPAAAPPAGPAR